MKDLPRPIQVAIGFLAADALWVLLLLARIGPRLWNTMDDSLLALFPLVGFPAWIGVAGVSIRGLLSRDRWALTSSIALLAVSLFLLAAQVAGKVLASGSLPLDARTLVILGGLACFLTPLVLLLAGRRAYLAPPGG